MLRGFDKISKVEQFVHNDNQNLGYRVDIFNNGKVSFEEFRAVGWKKKSQHIDNTNNVFSQEFEEKLNDENDDENFTQVSVYKDNTADLRELSNSLGKRSISHLYNKITRSDFDDICSLIKDTVIDAKEFNLIMRMISKLEDKNLSSIINISGQKYFVEKRLSDCTWLVVDLNVDMKTDEKDHIFIMKIISPDLLESIYIESLVQERLVDNSNLDILKTFKCFRSSSENDKIIMIQKYCQYGSLLSISNSIQIPEKLFLGWIVQILQFISILCQLGITTSFRNTCSIFNSIFYEIQDNSFGEDALKNTLIFSLSDCFLMSIGPPNYDGIFDFIHTLFSKSTCNLNHCITEFGLLDNKVASEVGLLQIIENLKNSTTALSKSDNISSLKRNLDLLILSNNLESN